MEIFHRTNKSYDCNARQLQKYFECIEESLKVPVKWIGHGRESYDNETLVITML